ncbi:Isochorismatase family [Legionella wadsworthii]|uniref:Isochorismatase family n=1 Tax=Legionella wadsworthii TaxID=28088 RepID=A0A378LMC5_9GAMM|nr:isochorismatase [Legionella wadsworthii]STY27903.1 Isochorismatase family [Legionella wadsworthii]
MFSDKKLLTHLQTQEHLQKRTSYYFTEINQIYAIYGATLKEELKKTLLNKLDQPSKLAILLVDLQNDFVLPGFALYVPDGENTLISNMALLDAVTELVISFPELCNRIELITSQDAHVYKRNGMSPDAQTLKESYGEEHIRRILQIEYNELQNLSPENGQYGLHCLCGTIGAAIAQPIGIRLTHLQKKIAIYRFAKINFSAPEAGIQLQSNIDLSDSKFLTEINPVYASPALSFLKFFQNKDYKEILITGICGNICVQQAAEGLAKAGEKVCVVDPCVHYLIIPGMSSYHEIKASVQQSYDAKGIMTLEHHSFPSNYQWNKESQWLTHEEHTLA